MKKLIQFDWVLEVKINSPWIIALLFHPIYIIWLYKIGRLGEKQLAQKSNKLFLIVSVFLFLTTSLILFPILLFSEDLAFFNLLFTDNEYFINIIIVLMSLSWIYCSYYSMRMTIKLDELKNKDYYPSITDKLFRFFQILYWLFGIWIIQPNINEYHDEFIKGSIDRQS